MNRYLVLILSLAATAAAIPIVGSSAATLDQGGFMFELHGQYLDLTQRWDTATARWRDLPDSEWVRTVLVLPQFYYGLRDWLCVRATVPLLRKDVNLGKARVSSGLGDIVLDAKWRFLEAEGLIPTASLFGGVRFGTGDLKQNPPLGDGSTDFVLGLLATERIAKFASSLMLGYWVNGMNVAQVDVDDQLFYNLSLEYGLPLKFAVVTELDGSFTGGLKKQALAQVCLGLQNRVLPRLVLEGSVIVPVWAREGYKAAPAPFIGGFVTF